VDSLFMTPLQKKKKIQQLLIEKNQEMDDDRGKMKRADMRNSSQMEEISLESILKSETVQFGDKLEKDQKGGASSIPENLRDLELKEISSGDVTAVEFSDQQRCGVEESDDESDEGEESGGGSEEEEDCSDSSSDRSEGEDDCSDDEENRDDGESEKFWNLEQMEILKSALPSFHFLPRTTVEKVVTELKVLGGCPDRVKYFARVWLERRGREGEDRLEVRRRKLQTVDHAQGTEPRLGKKVKFLQ